MGPTGSDNPRRAGSPRSQHPSQRARRRRVAAEKRTASARILVSESDRGAKPAVSDVVRGMGYEVIAHHTLADALREATTGNFDVIVASVPTLADEKVRLLQVLRRATPNVPLVIVTSDGSLEMRIRCQSARPFYYAVRPVDEAELRSILTGALARGTASGN